MTDLQNEKQLENSAAQKKKQLGATMVEYAILTALVAVVCIASLAFLGQAISGKFSEIASLLS